MIKTLCFPVLYKDFFSFNYNRVRRGLRGFFRFKSGDETVQYSVMTDRADLRESARRLSLSSTLRPEILSDLPRKRISASVINTVFFFYKITLSHCLYYLFQTRDLQK